MRTKFDRLDLAEKYQKKDFLEFDFEIKQIEEVDNAYIVKGYGAAFNNEDRGGDVILPGAFKETLRDFMPSFLWMHKFDTPIGAIVSAKEDAKGLFIEARCPREDTFVSGRVIPQMRIGSVKSMSIGYYAEEFKEDENYKRTISKIVLFEISPVHLPMNQQATIESVKSMDIETVKEIKSNRDFEKCLRDSGAFSRSAAVYLAKFFNMPTPSDSDEGLKGLLAKLSELKTATQKFKEL